MVQIIRTRSSRLETGHRSMESKNSVNLHLPELSRRLSALSTISFPLSATVSSDDSAGTKYVFQPAIGTAANPAKNLELYLRTWEQFAKDYAKDCSNTLAQFLPLNENVAHNENQLTASQTPSGSGRQHNEFTLGDAGSDNGLALPGNWRIRLKSDNAKTPVPTEAGFGTSFHNQIKVEVNDVGKFRPPPLL